MGQRRRSQHVRNESAYPPIAAGEQTWRLVGSVPTSEVWIIYIWYDCLFEACPTTGPMLPKSTRFALPNISVTDYPAGLMFGLRWKKLLGSYLFFSAANRS